MIQVYLPIAEMTVDALVLIALGAATGVLSGLFGVGGGFLMTPILLFIGIPPAIAVATQANQLAGASLSGSIAHWRKRTADFELGAVMLAGGAVGTSAGIGLFTLLKALGQIDLVIQISYVLLLGGIGVLMLRESLRALLRRRQGGRARPSAARPAWQERLPLRMTFERSHLTISALVPFAVGLVGGLLVSIMGIGGGFILVPAMIYIIRMPVNLVPGTSLFQIIFTTSLATFLQAVTNHTVDLVLAGLLLLGAVTGSQAGVYLAQRLPPEWTRLLMSVIVLAVAGNLLRSLIVSPEDPFVLEIYR